jgi:hypothetical protein
MKVYSKVFCFKCGLQNDDIEKKFARLRRRPGN